MGISIQSRWTKIQFQKYTVEINVAVAKQLKISFSAFEYKLYCEFYNNMCSWDTLRDLNLQRFEFLVTRHDTCSDFDNGTQQLPT